MKFGFRFAAVQSFPAIVLINGAVELTYVP